jgi:hypothetical protein
MNKVISWENKKNDEPLNYDNKILNLFQNLQKIEKKNKNIIFQEWLQKKNIDNIQYKTIIHHLCNDLINIIKDSNFTITNEKQLKNEIATFIYSVSHK